MKQLSLFILLMCSIILSKAQLYSSGNNVIAGTNVGIGTNAPSAKLQVSGSVAPATEIRIQHTNLTAGASRLSFFNDTQTGFSSTADYAVMNKYAKGITGNYSPGFKNSQLFIFGNAQGSLLFNTGGNIGFGYFNQAANTTITRMYIDSLSGNLGIGNTTPATRLHVHSTLSGDTIKLTNATTGSTVSDGLDIRTIGNTASIINRENSSLDFGTNSLSRMTIDASGNVIIGSTTTPGGYKLFVEQGILTEKVKVAVKTSANWADYVFGDEYKLTPLHEVASYIKTNKHLPGIPSAKEVVEQGVDLATMDAKLLEKIEELTLHMIRMESELDALKKENEQLRSNSSNHN